MTTLYVAVWARPNSPSVRVAWRAMTQAEYRSVVARYGHLELTLYAPMDLYLDVYKTIVLEGPPVDQVTAGIAAQVALHQLNNNPFSGVYQAIAAKLQEKRQWLEHSWIDSARAIIASVFRLSFDEIDKLDADQFFERYVQAEYALGHQFDPVDPSISQPKQARNGPQRPLSAREVAFLKAKQRRNVADVAEQGLRGSPSPDVEQFTWTR